MNGQTSGQTTPQPAPAGPPGGGLFAPPPADAMLSPEMVQHLVDRAAHFNTYSMPDGSAGSAAVRGSGSDVVGVRVHEVLHRFSVVTEAPTADRPLRARNAVGEAAGRFTSRWMFAPDDFVARPDRQPPPTRFDRSRPQRLVMYDGRCTFGDGEDGFHGFGAGHTYPKAGGGGGGPVPVAAVGTVLEGFGRFAGHTEGTYIYCGTLDPERGFQGNLLLRLMDREGSFRSERSLPPVEARHDPEPGVTYLMIRGEAVPSDPVTPGPQGLTVEQGLRTLETSFAVRGRGGIRSSQTFGPYIGRITAQVKFDPSAPGGGNLDPIPFSTDDEFVFLDGERRATGSFHADSDEGRVFGTALARHPGIRFGGIGRVLSGSGPFQGIGGLMTDSSVVVFVPHVSASVYLLRVPDPDGRFRSG